MDSTHRIRTRSRSNDPMLCMSTTLSKSLYVPLYCCKGYCTRRVFLLNLFLSFFRIFCCVLYNIRIDVSLVDQLPACELLLMMMVSLFTMCICVYCIPMWTVNTLVATFPRNKIVCLLFLSRFHFVSRLFSLIWRCFDSALFL